MNLSERIRAVVRLDPAAEAIEFEGRWHAPGHDRGPQDLAARALHRRGLARRRALPPPEGGEPRARGAAHGARRGSSEGGSREPAGGHLGHRPARARDRARRDGVAGGVAGWTLEDHRSWAARKRGSAGRAHPGCALRVVDPADGRALEPGGVGLLEVRSAQLGRDSGWVRTTDLAEIDADGFLWIRGRADDAIFRGGFKIAPADVVAVLERHPAVREAAVVGIPDERLGLLPVAAVELESGAAASEDELRDFARQHLASYQVPARIRIVAALPRTPSLKVSQPDVKALLAPEGSAG